MTKEALGKQAEEYTKSVINIDGFDWKIIREICLAYIAGYEAGFKDCAKARLNATTISDCPIKDDELEKENAKLKEENERLLNEFADDYQGSLTIAKEIIKKMLRDIPNRMWYSDETIKQAEAFLEE